jgi:hypothetical protein
MQSDGLTSAGQYAVEGLWTAPLGMGVNNVINDMQRVYGGRVLARAELARERETGALCHLSEEGAAKRLTCCALAA